MSVDSSVLAPGVWGFGYQSLSQQQLVEQVPRAGVEVLADVRLNPISRKKGLSKSALAAALESAGVTYVHLRGLGHPKWNRRGFATDDPEARRVYGELIGEGAGLRDFQALQVL